MPYKEKMNEINSVRAEMIELRARIRALQAEVEPEVVRDYLFETVKGEVTLSSLFGAKDTLFVVHNMGRGCSYCTQWADGFNGVLDHLQDRAAFVVSSPDAPDVQKAFADQRGWRFDMVSHDGQFAKDMGYFRDGGHWPGVSVFQKKDGEVLRVSDTTFGPGDDFNAVWNFFDMIPEGANGWQPKFDYS